MSPKRLNLSSPDFAQHAHAHFARMRQEAAVHDVQLASYQRAFVLTRYDDTVEMLRSPQFLKNVNSAKSESGHSTMFWLPPNFRPILSNMLNTDEPDHRRLRNLVHKAFTPKMIQSLEGRIQKITDELLDQMASQGSVEFVSDFALPLPLQVISDMIGVPPEDRAYFSKMTRKIFVDVTPVRMLMAIPLGF